MAERTAILLVFAAMLVVMSVAFVVLVSMRANEDVLVLAYLLVLVGGAYASSSVVMRYADKRRRR